MEAPTKLRCTVSLDRARLNTPKMVEWIKSVPWDAWQTEDQIKRSLHNSSVFGAYLIPAGEQVGFASVLSDGAAYSIITHTHIALLYRGKGLGRALMQAVVGHNSVAKTICVVQTRVPEFYSPFGFVPIGGTVMSRKPTGL